MLDDIVNFVQVGERLGTAGQPNEAQLAMIRDAGYELLINLGLLDPRYCLADEAKSVGDLGMGYEHVPVNFRAPTRDDFARFVRAMQGASEQRVFVHCALNYRVSCFVALYGEAHLGWSREAADQHIARIWEPDATWRAFLGEVRNALSAAKAL